MTKEHVFPKFLYDYQKTFSKVIGWNFIANKMLPNEQMVKDVCADCNNVVLGELDAYGKSFLQSNGFLTQNFESNKIDLKYDYDQLLRWMLKISFNSARRKTIQSRPFIGLEPYILGKNALPPSRRVLMFAQLLNGIDISNHPIRNKLSPDFISSTNILNPFLVRVSYLGEIDPALYDVNVRINIFGPLMVYLAIFDDGASSEYVKQTRQSLLKKFHNIKLLSPNQKRKSLKQSTSTWLDAYEVQLSLQKQIEQLN